MAGTAQAPLRVALLGYGLAGRVFHAPLIAATPGLTLHAVVTRDPERRQQVRRDHPDARLVDDAELLWRSRDALDLVVVATPNRQHVAMARAAVAAGLAVVVDKPLAANAAEGRELVDEAARRGVPLTVFQNRRWDGDFLTVRRLVEQGELGRVTRFESRFERWRPSIKPGWRRAPHRARPAAPSTTWAPTSSTRPCSCSGRPPTSTRRSTAGERARRSTTTRSWR